MLYNQMNFIFILSYSFCLYTHIYTHLLGCLKVMLSILLIVSMQFCLTSQEKPFFHLTVHSVHC